MVNKAKFWKSFKRFLKKKGLVEDERIIDLIAVYPILSLCAKGLSNKTIARILQESELDIKSILNSYLKFDGFDETLDFEPYLWYNELEKVVADSGETTKIKKMLEQYFELERRIQEHYDKHP